MQQLKNIPDFADRQQTAAAAKQAILAKFKPKPTIQAVEPIDRDAERRAKSEALRAQREADKAAKELAKIEAEARAVQAKMEAKAREVQAKIEEDASEDAVKRAERKARKAAMKENARIKRELNQQARR